jgi:tetratricopeptide (TPR) repeat protein
MLKLDRSRIGLAIVMLHLMCVRAPAQIPDEFTNLEILPKDIGKRELVAIMRQFSAALGVRCSHCHVGEDPEDLATFDFASDEKKHKQIARKMMKMTHEINNRLVPAADIEEPTRVRCVTCHRGLENPETLENLLVATAEEEGADAAISEYRATRDTYYGKGSYDFSASTLANVSETLAAGSGDVEGALAMARLNIEFNPEVPYAHIFLGRLLMQTGDAHGAVASFERALELEPDNPWAQQMLERAKASR